ncbi:DUF6381 family protein [Streptomyces sp. NPDC054841]
MTTAGEPVRTPEQLRAMAEELTRGADRCNDPEHRARLRRKAEELRQQYDADSPGAAGSASTQGRQDRQDVQGTPGAPGAPTHHHHQRQHGPRGPQRPGPERPRGA